MSQARDRLVTAGVFVAMFVAGNAYLVLDGTPRRQLPWLNAAAAALFAVGYVVQRAARRPRAHGPRDPAFRGVYASDGDALERASTVLFGDQIARLWLEGEPRRTLHGLQPQPAEPLALVGGELLVTRALREQPPAPLPIAVAHRASLAADAPELLTLVELDGTVRWTVTFTEPTLARARGYVAAPDRLLFVLDEREGPRARWLAVDRATGALTWEKPRA